MRPLSPSIPQKTVRSRGGASRAWQLDDTPSMHPLARRRMSLVGPEVPPTTVQPSDLGRGNGHLIEIPAGATTTVRPRPLDPDGAPRHHIVTIGAGARVDLLLDDPFARGLISRSAEAWVGANARLRLVDRSNSRNGAMDLLGLHLEAGASVELIGLRRGIATSTIIAVDLAPGARGDLTWVQSATEGSAVDVRVRGSNPDSRHMLMLSAPIGPGTHAIRLAVECDRSGIPRCDSVQMGIPECGNLAGWDHLLPSLGPLGEGRPVAMPPIPPSLRDLVKRRTMGI